jgi:hypothetical protein
MHTHEIMNSQNRVTLTIIKGDREMNYSEMTKKELLREVDDGICAMYFAFCKENENCQGCLLNTKIGDKCILGAVRNAVEIARK